MTNSITLISLLVVYLIFLAATAFQLASNRNSSASLQSNHNYLFGNFGFMLSFFGIAATLFSTFTLTGMPAFFKNHGIASWVFLGVTDVCLAALLLYFGLKIRNFTKRLSQQTSIKNLTELLKISDMPQWAIFFFVTAVTIFMIPYITIQIKGTAVLLQTAIPIGDSHLAWSIFMVILMLSYSWFGGLRAIFVTDMIQGIVLLVTVWAIAYFAIDASGGISHLFTEVQKIQPELLSAPGPAGLLNWQFLLISFISIILMPYVQPQMATRILVAKDDKTFVRSTMALAIFAIFVILPALFIGLRSVIVSQSVTEGNFILNVIYSDAPAFFYSLFIVGVLAAAMSTADSQLMAIGTEWGSIMTKKNIQNEHNARIWVKTISIIVALVSLILAQSSFKSLVLFAVNSFIGTSLLLPIIFSTVIKNESHKLLLLYSSVVSVVIFILILSGLVSKTHLGIRAELIIYAYLASIMLWAWLQEKNNTDSNNEH